MGECHIKLGGKVAYLQKIIYILKRFEWFILACLFYQIILMQGYAHAWGTPPWPVVMYEEVLVRYQPQATYADIINTYRQLNLYEVSYSPFSGTRRVRVPINIAASAVAVTLNQNPLVAYAEPNYLRATHFVPNDPLYELQWHLTGPVMQQTWDLALGTNVLVAVLDTGISYRHGDGYARAPDLTDTAILPGYDFVNDDEYPDDDNHHGTHIAGTIAQSTNNFLGGAGVAPGCTLMPVKVLNNEGYGETADIVDGIYYAVNNGAQIINMSLGGPRSNKGRGRDRSAIEEEAVNYAVSEGVTIICSAGNDASDIPNYPAAYEACISVSACKYDQAFAAAYSNFGLEVDICAPGGDYNEDLNGDGHPDGIYQETHDGVNYMDFDFYFADGTSSAAAFASGVAALVVSSAPKPLTPAEVRDILQSSAIDLGDPGWDQFYGWGLVNPLAAVQTAIAYSAESRLIQTLRYHNTNHFLNSLANLAVYSMSIPLSANTLNQINQNFYQANAGFTPFNQTTALTRNAFSNQIIPAYQMQNNYSLEIGKNESINPQEFTFISTISNPYLFNPIFSSDSLSLTPLFSPSVAWPSLLFSLNMSIPFSLLSLF